MDGLHHMHMRKRLVVQNVCEPYPARTRSLRSLDRLMFVVAIFSPLALLPQTIHIFVHGDAAGLSIWTWIALGFVNALWTVYGLIHKDKPITIANGLIALLDIAIVIGILKYS